MHSAGCSATIQVLPGDVVSRIAAGEVIERPAAVVKELVENSLDAGSRHISIDVKDGGASLIRVTDDGEGINRADLLLAFERHATSKLRSDRDLTSVTTLGFRGEALPSIASVSKVVVTTAAGQDAMGTQVRLVGGRASALTDAPPVRGTKIEVADLFYNQPARKKFLRSSATEFSHIQHVVQQAGLAWPAVHFRLTHNGQEILNYPAVASDRDRILQVYRPAFLERTVEVQGRLPGCALRGVTIEPVHAKSTKQPQDLFVNRRPVKSAVVVHAVTEAYGAFLSRGHYPIFVLFLEIDPDRIDVNVHPTKREVRFAETESVHRLVRHAVRHALSGPERKMVLGMSAPDRTITHSLSRSLADVHGETREFPSDAAEIERGASRPGTSRPSVTVGGDQSQLTFVQEDAGAYASLSASSIVPLGQMLRRYLIAQVGQELQVIDQHTAHERVMFQRLWRRWQSRDATWQPLLIPEPVELSDAQYGLLQQHLPDLEKLGLHIEPFGQATVVIRAVPVGVGKFDAASLLQDLTDDLSQWDQLSSMEQRVPPVLASLACHSAVRAGRAMALPEIQQLIQDWVDEGLIMTCPHGRRTAFRLSTDELDKLFGRVGWS